MVILLREICGEGIILKLKKKIVSNSISNQVYEELKRNIVSLHLRPGSNISEKEISDQLEVSRTPVREAFVRLAQEELLEIYPQKGTLVSLIDLNDVKETLFIRESLEKATIRLACQNFTLNQLQNLKNNMVMQENSIKNSDFHTFLELDEEFHRIIAEMSQKRKVWSAIQRSDAHLKRIRVLSLTDEYKGNILFNEHKEILEAVEERDEDKAERVLQNHLRNLIIERKELKQAYPQYFVS